MSLFVKRRNSLTVLAALDSVTQQGLFAPTYLSSDNNPPCFTTRETYLVWSDSDFFKPMPLDTRFLT